MLHNGRSDSGISMLSISMLVQAHAATSWVTWDKL